MMWLWIGGGVAVFFAAGVGLVLALRRVIWSRENHNSADFAFSLDELRMMHRQGQLTDKEYEQLRDAAIQRTAT